MLSISLDVSSIFSLSLTFPSATQPVHHGCSLLELSLCSLWRPRRCGELGVGGFLEHQNQRAELVLFISVPLPERCERTHVYSCFCALTSFDFHSLSHSHLTTFLIALKLRAAARKTNSVSVSGQLSGPCFEFMFWLLVVRREIEALKFVLSLSSTHCIGFEEMGVKMHSTQCLRAAVLLCLLGVTIESRLNCDEVKKVFQLRQIGPSMWLPEIPRSGEHSRTLDKTGTQSALSTFCAKYRS